MASSVTTLVDPSSNLTTTHDYGINDPNGVSRIPALVFLCILFSFGTVGNGHALILNVKRYREWTSTKHRKDPYVVFVLSLAIIDLLICMFVIPLDFVDNSSDFSLLSEFLCKTFRYVQYSLHTSSVAHVTLICIHCWRKVCLPNEFQIERSLALKLCVGCNLMGFISLIPNAILFGYAKITVNGRRGQICFTDEEFKDSLLLKLCMGLIASAFFICLMVIFISYVALIRYFFQYRKKRNSIRKETKEKKESGNTTIILIILTVVLIVSYIPFMILGSLAVDNTNFRRGWNVATLATYRVFSNFPYLNNVLNPVVYGCIDHDFRKRLRQMYAPLMQTCSFSK